MNKEYQDYTKTNPNFKSADKNETGFPVKEAAGKNGDNGTNSDFLNKSDPVETGDYDKSFAVGKKQKNSNFLDKVSTDQVAYDNHFAK